MSCEELGGDSQFCLSGLRELLQLVARLRGRYSSLNCGCGVIEAPQDIEEVGYARAEVARVHRGGESGGAWEGFPESAHREVTQRNARLMAQMLTARVRKATGVKEASDEPNDA